MPQQENPNRGRPARLAGAPDERVEVPKLNEALVRNVQESEVKAPKAEGPHDYLRAAAKQQSGALQRAQAQRAQATRPRGQTGSAPNSFSGVSPMANSIKKAKALALAANLGGRDLGPVNEQVQDALNDPNISSQEFERLIQPIIKQQQNEPAKTIPGGSVTIGRGTGPNAVSPNDIAAGAARFAGQLAPGETETQTPMPENSYTVKLPDRVQQPLAGGKPAPKAEETPYQREQLATKGEEVRTAQEAYNRDQKAVEDDPKDAAAQKRMQDDQTQLLGVQKARQGLVQQLPGAPSPQGEPGVNPAPVAPPPQQPAMRVFPTGNPPAPAAPAPPQGQWPRPPEQGGPPKNPGTGLPIVQNDQHLMNVPVGQIVHLPDGRMVRRIAAPQPQGQPQPAAPQEADPGLRESD